MNWLKRGALTLALGVVSTLGADVYYGSKNYDALGYCCYRDGGFYGPNNTIRWDSDFADEWQRRGVTNEGKVSFPDLSEQSLTSGFERATYNTPK